MVTTATKPRRNSSQRLIARTVPVRIQAQSADPKAKRTFTLTAYTGEAMNIGFWDLPIVVDLASLDLSVQRIPALYDHSTYTPDCIVGQVESLTVQGGTLVASGFFTVTDDVPPERNYALQVLNKADAGYEWQASIGGNPATMDEIKAGEIVNVNGRDYTGPLLIARGVSLREISFVVLGGDRRTSAMVSRQRRSQLMAKAIKAASLQETVSAWAAIFGVDPEGLEEDKMALAKILYDAQSGGAPAAEPAKDAPTNAAEGETPPEEEEEEKPMPANAAGKKPKIQATDPTAELRTKAAAELKRHSEIRARVSKYKLTPEHKIEIEDGGSKIEADADGLIAHAIEKEWTPDQAEIVALRASRGTGPIPISRSHERDCTREALQAGLLARCTIKVPDRDSPTGFRNVNMLEYQFKNRLAVTALGLPSWLSASVNDPARNKLMDFAHRYSRKSGVDLCREACRIDGRSIPDDYHELVATAVRPLITAAASSGSALTNIFTTNVNAVLLATYEQFGDTTAGWVSEEDVADFKSNERPRVDIGGGLKKLPRGKSAEHADYTDSAESYKIARYAKQFVVDEQDIIDDSLGALANTPQEFGMAAARLRPDLVYAIILDNPTLTATNRALFNTTDGNLMSATALSMVNLQTAVKSMLLFRENSVNLGLMPTHLLLPPALEFIGWELVKSPQQLYGADDETLRGNLNAMYQRGIMPVVEPRLENGLTDPSTGDSETGSATAWFLVCATAHTIVVGYLRGSGRAPKVRTKVLDEGRYGIQWDVALDIGAKGLDWKGLIKNAGA